MGNAGVRADSIFAGRCFASARRRLLRAGRGHLVASDGNPACKRGSNRRLFFLLFFGEKIRTKSPRLVGGQGRGGKIRRLHRQSQQGNFSYYADSALFPRRRAVHNRGHNRHELSVLRGGNRIGASADNRGVLLSRQRLDYSVFGLGNTCVARDNRRVCDACRVVLQISEKI